MLTDLPEEIRSRPFLVSRALELGVSRETLRGSRFRAPVRGVRVPAELPDTLRDRCWAASLVLGEAAAFSHVTALGLRRLPMPVGWTDDGVLDVGVPRGCSVPYGRGVRGHEALWLPEDVSRFDGLRVVSPARTLIDLAGSGWQVRELLCVADAVLSRGEHPTETKARLEARIDAYRGRPGAPLLRRVLELAEAGPDSAMETVLRYLLVSAGLPRPQVNVEVWEDDAFVHKPDLSWPRWKVAADYDGAHHFVEREGDGERRRRLDTEARERMHDAGWLVRVMTKTDVLRSPARCIDRTRSALRERGCPV